MAERMPECRAHGDCFANKGGRCVCLKDNDFGGRGCPFYKPAGTAQGEQRRQDGGLVYGNRKV